MAKRYHYSLYTSKALIEKARFVANHDGRSLNKQIERLLMNMVKTFEAKHGEIETSNPEEDFDET